jgi:PIN domain nuclease of toxin-antitoxin system
LNGYLLDTNVILIALTAPDRLSAAVRQAVLAGPNILSVTPYRPRRCGKLTADS